MKSDFPDSPSFCVRGHLPGKLHCPTQARLEVNPFAIYNRMVVEQEAGYNAYVEHDEMAVISMSPELFFEQNDRES